MESTIAGRGLQPCPSHRRDRRLDDYVLTHPDSFKINPTYNSDGLINWLRQPGQLRNQLPKSMVSNLSQLIKYCVTQTDPAAKTKSIGLPADALVPYFLLAVWTVSS